MVRGRKERRWCGEGRGGAEKDTETDRGRETER